MINKITPFLIFDGDAEHALDYYQQIFGGIKSVFTRFGDSEDYNEEEAIKKKIDHAKLETYYFDLFLSDTKDSNSFLKGNHVALTLDFDSEESIDQIYTALSKDAVIHSQLHKTAWNAKYAQLTDQFGVNWNLNYQYE